MIGNGDVEGAISECEPDQWIVRGTRAARLLYYPHSSESQSSCLVLLLASIVYTRIQVQVQVQVLLVEIQVSRMG